MATPSSSGDGNGDNMNASLWGKLQIFIDLSMIYSKLPLAPFFRLRQVYKEWNRLASDRQFLEQNFKPPISSNPYFILTHQKRRHVLLISEGSSWTSTPVPQTQCEMLGLLFEESDRNRVFDLHTRVFYTLPPLPKAMQLLPFDFACTMMTVDTTQVPYGFTIIIVDEIVGTRIYESNCGFWTHKPSVPMYSQHEYDYCPLSVHYNKSLYIKVQEFLGYERKPWKYQTYNLERDEWIMHNNLCLLHSSSYIDITKWQDRWFVFLQEEGLNLTVKESVSNFEAPWTLFDRMPSDLYEWVKELRHVDIMMIKCYGEHILVHSGIIGVKRAILYNLDRKTWDKIELPI